MCLEELEEKAASRPFNETFKDAMDFQSALWEFLGLTPVSSGEVPAADKAKVGKKRKPEDSPSEN